MSRADRSNSESRHTTISGETETDDSEFPPDSIVIPITEDSPWQYSAAYDSGESTREITNPKSHSNPFPWSKTGPASNQVAAANLNAAARTPIMGIPAKMKLPAFAHSQGPPSIFPRWRNSRLKKSGLAYGEPGSPKVSCWGQVLSEREKEKLRKQREARRELERKNEVPSCCSKFSAILACASDRAAGKRGDSHFQLAEVHPPHAESVRRSLEKDLISSVEEVRPPPDEAEATGLGALKRFSSGRRAASWGADAVTERGLAAQENNLN